jgi:putative DNA primase/helicase
MMTQPTFFGPMDEAEVNIIELLASDKPESEKRGALVEEILNRIIIKTLRNTGEILFYDPESGIYRRGGEEKVREELVVIGAYEISNTRRNEVLETIRDKTYVDREEFDNDPNVLNLKNGLLDIESGEFQGHSDEYLSISQMPVEYDPRARCPNFIKFLRETIEPEHFGIVVKLFGYLLVRNSIYEKAFMLVGEGSNGKSTLIKVLIALLGRQNCSSKSLQEITGDRFAKAELYGKMANFYPDLPRGKITDSTDFKALTSGDTVSAQKKHQQPFDLSNYAKLVFSTNQIPPSEDVSYAYMRRWVIIPFNHTFEGDEKDEHLLAKLTTPEELSGILNLALKGLKKLKEERGFKEIDVEEIRRQYELGASRIKSFLEELCTIEQGNEDLNTESKRLKEAYHRYCKEKGTTFIDEKKFGEELKKLGIKHKQKMANKKRTYYEFGIALKSDSLLNSLGKPHTSWSNRENCTIGGEDVGISPKELSNPNKVGAST